jgi:hypothetical protein
MTSMPTINHGFINFMESKRPFKRNTRLSMDQIRAIDFQTTKIQASAVQNHLDQVNIQQQLIRYQNDLLKLFTEQQKEMMKNLENITLLLKNIAPEKQPVIDPQVKSIKESITQ